MSNPVPISQVSSAVPYPLFEGRTVDAACLRIAGTTPTDDVEDIVVSVDDRVRLVGDYKVVGVKPRVDPKSGVLIREQLLKPITVGLIPFDPNDPNDDGVLRAP